MKTEQLHSIVRSLTKSEKKGFVEQNTRKGGTSIPHYVKVFDILSKMSRYSEANLVTQVKRQRIPGTLQLHKKYLKDVLIKDITAQRLGRTEANFTRQYEEVVTCLNFGIYEEGLRLLARIETFELTYTQQVQLMDLKWMLIERDGFSSLSAKKLEKHFKNRRALLKKGMLSSELRMVNAELKFMFEQIGFARSKKTIAVYRKLLKSEVLNQKEFLNKEDERLTCNTKAMGHIVMGNYKKAIKWAEREVGLIDFRTAPENYLFAVNNLLLALLNTGKDEQFRQVVDALEQSGSIRNVDKLRFEVVGRNQLRFIIARGAFIENIPFAEEFERKFREFEGGLSAEMIPNIAFYLFNFWFGAGEYTRAKKALNIVLNSKGEIRRDLQNFARILNVLLHYERGDIQYFDSLVRSIMHFAKANWSLSQFGFAMLQFVKSMRSTPDKKDTHLQQLQEALLRLKKTEEARAFEYFDFLSWTESKLSGVSYAEVIQNKR